MTSALQSGSPAVPENLLKFLRGLSNTSASHSGKTLADHLVATYQILASWGSAEYVCKAGLFHSIYGTEAFPSSSLDESSRMSLRRLIGERAEALVYDFHRVHWNIILGDKEYASRLAESSEGLFEVAIANLIEQVPRLVSSGSEARAFLDASREYLALAQWLSKPAHDSLLQLLAKLEIAERCVLNNEC